MTLLDATAIQLTVTSHPITLKIEPGEIIGLAGLDGHGQEQFLEILGGISSPAGGSVRSEIDGGMVSILSQRQAARAGIVFLPRDRKSEGIFPSMSVIDNFAIASMKQRSRFGVISTRRTERVYLKAKDRLGITAAWSKLPVTGLSGGNQQKVLLARLLELDPQLLLLNDPTRGVDHTTRLAFYDIFRELVGRGDLSIVLLSTELEELVDLCSRVLVFREHSCSAVLKAPGIEVSTVIESMFGSET